MVEGTCCGRIGGGFLAVLLVVLVAMATFRSPAVALMPDVTVKPLRSKANAIINLMGTAGGIIILVLSTVMGTSKKLYMHYSPYVLLVCCVMIAGLVVFLLSVKEKKWAAEMEEQSVALGLEEKVDNGGEKRSLSKAEMTSLLLILASVALWYIGYNSITSKYTVYATTILNIDYGLSLIVAQAAAGGLVHITGHGDQFTGLGHTVGGVEHVDDHITGDGDTFLVHRKTSFLLAMRIFFQNKF